MTHGSDLDPDTSKVLEPPETPAPVFAIRAFKSALFGTPGAEDQETGGASESQAAPKLQGHQRSRSETAKPIPIEPKEPAKADLDTTVNPSGSPTKSILVTPGTISNRRKTVSFGDGVVDNEGKRDSKAVKTPPNPAGNLTAQWMSGSADGKPRSKLTQTLMDARDNASKNAEPGNASSDATATARPQPKSDSTTEDITLNLEDPRSESGKYWKTEFDNYRVRTNREIKKLIHYRCVAKSYARKKDSEALRLADKLREEEEKVAEMERQVSRLAATILGEGSKADKEQLIQDLTKQTTLALQYKQQVTSLRHMLEQQGVVEGDTVKVEEPVKHESSSETADELRRIQQELKEANAKVEELTRENPDLDKLQTLASRAEKKAQGLEKENNTLKQALARVKQDMTRYESRRKDKEAKAKHRESKLETRVQDYRERLKRTSQEHRESEETLRNDFDEERRRMQQQIDLLKMRVASAEHVPALRSHRQSLSPRKEYTGVHAYDFAEHDNPEEVTDEIEAPPSPSPRSKAREARHATTGALEYKLNHAATNDITADDEEVTHYLNEILPRPHHRSYQPTLDPIPPSSPPDISDLKSFHRPVSNPQPTDDKRRSYRSLHARESDLTDTVHRSNTHRPRSHIQSTLDSISGQRPSRAGAYTGYTIAGGERGGRRAGLSDMKSDILSPERYAAAKSRLRQKQDNRKMRAMGKENLRALAVSGEN
ncbi:hypothetical protein N7492_000323 [Penicillium capsulatum]|uniref:Spindle pole body-associated protein cut12 domain-containing protein n=1 Tax=Penicillium capsulatum TaxID=69766 RepID=A0A9W9LZX6_9EURO|nr:hypothetical protein N7492_000323 [Penicillium capsulatum]KAJ6130613.1 hypothetical protein N7512_003393 [Penicillium capsulatum]